MPSKKAEMGHGTLVIFIALLLVAAIAAGVILITGTSLQNKALATGKSAEEMVSTNIEVLGSDIEYDDDGTYRDYFLKVRLVGGSEPFSFSDTLVSVIGSQSEYNLVYGGVGCEYGKYYSDIDSDNGTYSVEYVLKSSHYASGYIFPGDIVRLCFRYEMETEDDRPANMFLVNPDGMAIDLRRRR